MRWRNALRFRESVLITLHGVTGRPLALRLRTRRLVWIFSGGLATVGGLFLGTLLFFREMESTRDLEARVLQLEIEARLQQDLAKLPVEVIDLKVDRATSSESQSKPEEKKKAPTPKPDRQARKVKSANQASVGIVPPVEAEFAKARFKSVKVDYAPPFAKVNVVLVREKKGKQKVKGSAIVVLETESSVSKQKQFYVYPGYRVRRNFDPKKVTSIRGNRFQFSTLLPLNVNFSLNKEMVPKVVRVYLLDPETKLLSERSLPVSLPKAESQVTPAVAGRPEEETGVSQ